MILKVRMKRETRENIKIIKQYFFDEKDKITSGYIIGLVIDKRIDITDFDWEGIISKIFCEKESGEANSTSISLRKETYDRIIQIHLMLKEKYRKSLYMSQVIDIILAIVVNNLEKSVAEKNL